MTSDNASNNKENINTMTKEDASRIQAAEVRTTRINNDNPSKTNPLSCYSCEAADNEPRPNQCQLHEAVRAFFVQNENNGKDRRLFTSGAAAALPALYDRQQ